MATALPTLASIGSYIGPALQWGSVAASAMGAVGSLSSGNSQANAYDAQAKSLEIQGEMSNLSAREKAAELSNEHNRLRATQIAQGSAAGVSMDSGSLLNIMADSASKLEKDRASILRSGALNYEAAKASAAGYSSASSTSKTSGLFGFGTSLLNGGGQAYDIGKNLKWW